MILPLLASAAVGTGVKLLFAMLLIGLVLSLAFEEKLHAKKSVIAGVYAVACLLLGTSFKILPFEKVVVGSHQIEEEEVEGLEDVELEGELHEGGHEVSMPVYIPAIDWSVIVILLGSSVFVDVISRSGLFKWLAIKVTKLSRGDPLLLLSYYGVMTVVFSAVLNNVTAMVIVGSLTAVSLDKLDRRDKLLGFLLTEGLLTNIGGLLTLISSVPNIIVGTAAGISFVDFFVYSVPYVVLATAATIIMATKSFGISRIKDPAEREKAAAMVDSFDENDSIESRGFFWFGAVMTVLFILTIATTSVLPWVSDLGMGFVAMAFAVVALIRYKSEADQIYRIVDWDLLGFFAGLFVVIYVMEYAGVLEALGHVLAKLIELGDKAGSAALLVASAVCSSVTDNIPLAAMLAKILGGLPGVGSDSPHWWAVILGANLGGNITPIGSASTLVAVTVMHKHKVPISFVRFVKLAVPFAAVQIVLAVIYLLLTK
ncbi:MAG: SLC13 family permease [Planctomycetota bacterium]